MRKGLPPKSWRPRRLALADMAHLPVSTTATCFGLRVRAGTMAANHSGVQLSTLRKIGLAWVLTLPAAILLSGPVCLP